MQGSPVRTMDIGFIGLGRMGAGMAANLLRAGHAVVVYDRTAAKVQPLLEQGAHAAARVASPNSYPLASASTSARVRATPSRFNRCCGAGLSTARRSAAIIAATSVPSTAVATPNSSRRRARNG